MNRFIYTLLLTALLSLMREKMSAKIFTSDSLTLEQVWNIIDSGNRQLKLAGLLLSESTVSVDIARDDLLPSLTASGSAVYNTKFKLYPNGLFSSPDFFPVSRYGYGFGYSFNLSIYEGGRNSRNIRIRKEENLRQQHEYDLQRNDIRYSAAVIFYDLYKFLHYHDYLSAEITAQKRQHHVIEDLYKNGIVIKSDVLRSNVKLSQLQLSLSELDKKILVASQRLNILMGHEKEDPVIIAYHDTTTQLEQHNYTEYVEIAISRSPAYKITLSDMKVANLNTRQIRSNLLPKVAAFSYYNYTYPQVTYYPYTNQLWSFGQTGVKVTYSLDNLYRNKHLLEKAKIIAARQTEKIRIKQDELSADIREAYLEYQQAAEAVSNAQENIIQNTESVRVIRNSYLNQESLLTDLLDAENSLLASKLALTSAIVNLRLSHVRLLAQTGIL